MLAIRAGQFAQAEDAASACFALGNEVGDVDALAYYGAPLVAIRTFQGREAELADLAASIATSPTLIERECAFGFAAALFALRAGRPDAALSIYERLRQRVPALTLDSADDLRTLADYAESAGRTELATSIRLETPIHHPRV